MFRSRKRAKKIRDWWNSLAKPHLAKARSQPKVHFALKFLLITVLLYLVYRLITGLVLDSKPQGSLAWLASTLGAIILGLSIFIATAKYMWPKVKAWTRQSSTTTPTQVPTKDEIEAAKERDKKWAIWIRRLRENPIFLGLYIIAAWFIAMWALWIFRADTAIWWWPGNKVSWWHWIRWDHPRLFWWTSILFVIGLWFFYAKNRFIRIGALLIWAPLALVWFASVWSTTARTPTWRNISTAIERDYDNLIIEYSHNKAEKLAAEKAQALKGERLTPQSGVPAPIPLLVGPNEWSRVVVIPPGYKFKCQEDGRVHIRINGRKIVTTRYPNEQIKFTQAIETLEFKSVENQCVNVSVSFSRWQHQ